MAGCKNNPPIIRGVYSFAAILFTLERITKTLTGCHFLSEEFIDDLLKSQLSAVTDPPTTENSLSAFKKRGSASPPSSLMSSS